MADKQAYEDKMKAEIDGVESKLDTMKRKAEQASEDEKLDYYKEIEALKDQKQDLQEKLDALREADEGAWDEMKSGVEMAFKDLQGAVKRAADRIS